MSDDEAHAAFVAIRWADTEGEPSCPRCGCLAVYAYTARRIWKCKACGHQFSVTSGTIFASRKLPIRTLLAAIAIFVNAAKGLSALQLGRDLDVQYKTAFVLAHKLREALGSGQANTVLSGHVEVDGAYFGGEVRQENRKEDRKDRRRSENQSGKRRVVVALRERGGRTLPFVFRTEAEAVPTIRERVATGSMVYVDEAPGWDALHARFDTRRINHSIAFSDDGACTNQAESYFARLRRAEWGQHHHISGKYLGAYAREMAWREDTRRRPNGTLHALAAGAALGHPVSRMWKGYWQRERA
jgi:transposase-like protein